MQFRYVADVPQAVGRIQAMTYFRDQLIVIGEDRRIWTLDPCLDQPEFIPLIPQDRSR
jgi:hypothetical protein